MTREKIAFCSIGLLVALNQKPALAQAQNTQPIVGVDTSDNSAHFFKTPRLANRAQAILKLFTATVIEKINKAGIVVDETACNNNRQPCLKINIEYVPGYGIVGGTEFIAARVDYKLSKSLGQYITSGVGVPIDCPMNSPKVGDCLLREISACSTAKPCAWSKILMSIREANATSSNLKDKPTAKATLPLDRIGDEAYPPEISKLFDLDVDQADFQERLAQYSVDSLKIWKKPKTPIELKVCFIGGTIASNGQIAHIASEWTSHANIQFNFGNLKPSAWSTMTSLEQQRQLTPGRKTDELIALMQAQLEPRVCALGDGSDIAISTQHGKGHWSLIGTDANVIHQQSIINGTVGPSMNFDALNPAPHIVLHEFGHALGFEHEHQNPQGHCDKEIDWDKAYKYYASTSAWSKQKTRNNLGPLLNGRRASLKLRYDVYSIMHYAIPVDIFKKKDKSPCYVASPNTNISDLDKAALHMTYPKDIKKFLYDQRYNLQRLVASSNLSDNILQKTIIFAAMADLDRVLIGPEGSSAE